MALIKCPECGKMFSGFATKCPQCGLSITDVARITKEKEEERQRLAKEQAEKEEKKRQERRKRAKKVIIKTFISIIIIAILAVGVFFAYDAIKTKRITAEVEAYLVAGDSCVANYHFDEAKKMYGKAWGKAMNDDMRITIQRHKNALSKAQEAADNEYSEALRKLEVFLEADDNEFSYYSNQCLDKMIQIYPEKEETIYYKNLRK